MRTRLAAGLLSIAALGAIGVAAPEVGAQATTSAAALPNACTVISSAEVKLVFGLSTIPTHHRSISPDECVWFPDPNSQADISLQVIPGAPGLSYAPNAKEPGETIYKEPRFGKTAFMIVEPGSTNFTYQRTDTDWISMGYPGEVPGQMVHFANLVHKVLH